MTDKKDEMKMLLDEMLCQAGMILLYCEMSLDRIKRAETAFEMVHHSSFLESELLCLMRFPEILQNNNNKYAKETYIKLKEMVDKAEKIRKESINEINNKKFLKKMVDLLKPKIQFECAIDVEKKNC